MKMTAELVREIFSYDPSIPFALRWRAPMAKASRIAVGDIAGFWHPIKAGSPELHRYVGLACKRFSVARLVWLYCKGEPIPTRIKFQDGDRGNCRIENLIAPMTPEQKWGHAKKYRISYRHGETGESLQIIHRRIALARYNITLEDYEAMLAAQKGVCAICGKPETLTRKGKVDSLAVDHCHDKNRVRGLLCHQCNNGLGRFLDDPALLRLAAAYLESHA